MRKSSRANPTRLAALVVSASLVITATPAGMFKSEPYPSWKDDGISQNNAEKDVRELQREISRLQTEFQEDVNLRRNEELGELQRALLKEVQEYAQGAGFDLVVGDGVLYASSTVNITENVLRAMEANFQAAGN